MSATKRSRSYAYDAGGNMTCNSGLTPGLDCASGASNITYPAQGPGSIRLHAAISIAGQLQQ
jgi:hypothetical protein